MKKSKERKATTAAKDGRIAPARAGQRQHHEQVHNRDIGNARVEMKRVNDAGDQQRPRAGQQAVEQVAKPAERAVGFDGQRVFYGTHTGATFPL